MTNIENKKDLSKNKGAKIALIILAAFSLAVCAAGAVTLFFAMEREFDHALHHFIISPMFATIAGVLCAGGCLIALAGAIIVPKDLKLDVKNRDFFPGIASSILAGLMCALTFGFAVKAGIPEGETKRGLLLAEVSFTALAAIYFFLRGSGLFIKYPAVALSGLLPAAMLAFNLLRLYFDETDPLNAPLKTYRVIMIVSLMLFFTAEAGLSIGRPKMNRKFIFASFLAVSSGGMIAISRLAARIVDPDHFGYDVIEVSLFAVLWLYAVIAVAQRLCVSFKTTCEIAEGNAFFDSESDTETDDAEEKEARETDEDNEIEDVTEDAEEVEDAATVDDDKEETEAVEDAETDDGEAEEAENDTFEEKASDDQTPDETEQSENKTEE